ncbi:M48 family metalloprotease [Ferrimonas balearica]|nr:M48 family metalloprotease [Ferrimonas balearica]MBY5921072.1 M48 family metalloprotease [Ferrimonas balearica]MBY5996243.1 M48 family metalloprotease [Ferrimonas balearica]
MKRVIPRLAAPLLFLAAMGLSLSVARAANELPELGTVASGALTIDKENEIGDAYMRVMRSQLPIVYDPVMTEYLNDVGHRIVAHANNVKTPFTFFLINNKDINAFAFFGGHVGVHTALFHYADSESELASVLSHEVAHVTQRHLARSIEAQQRTGPATLAGVLGSILLAMAVPEAGIAALQTTLAINAQGQINYTRSNELEADRIGMQTMVAAGFDPYASPSFFGKLAAQYRFASKPPAMLMTHPLPESRIADTRARASQYPHRNVPDNLMFQLAKARAEVRFSAYSADHLLHQYQRQLSRETYVFKEAAQYGLALTHFRMEEYKEAEALVSELLKQDDKNLFYLDTQTDILLATGRTGDAITLLEHARKTRPNNAVIDLNLANAYLTAKQPEKARGILERHLILSKDNMVVYDLLAQTYKALGMSAERHMVQAEILALRADYPRAIDQLQHAYRQSRENPLQLARIDARIKQLREAEQQMRNL